MRALGIDFGERRIGLALTDPGGSFAWPWKSLARSDDRGAVEAIAALCAEEGISVLVIGEPRRPADGAATAATERSRGFAEKLRRRTGLPVVAVDETLTSRAADEALAAGGGKRRRGTDRDGRRDAMAAQILLQEAVDRGLVAAASRSAP